MKLRRFDSKELSSLLDVLRSEWYFTVADLCVALEDGKAWSDLALPGRLKLEIKRELFAIQSQAGKSEGVSPIPDRSNQWMKYYSTEHNTFFFCNLGTEISQWEEPAGLNIEIFEDYDSSSSAEVSPTAKKSDTTEKHAGATAAKSKRALEKDDSDGLEDGDDDDDDDNDDDDDVAREKVETKT